MITDLRKPINRIAGPINRWGVGAAPEPVSGSATARSLYWWLPIIGDES